MQKNNDQMYIVIPAYNEEKVIVSVIDELKRADYNNIVVVDDGSTDSTPLLLKNKNIIFLRHVINRGKGAAIKTGIEAAKILGAKIVITFDADGQHQPDDIRKMVNKINTGYDVVLGKRDFVVGRIPVIKIIANYLGNFFTWMIYGLWVNDSQSGLRAYSNKAIEEIETTTERYEYDSEIIREIVDHSLKYVEVPINVRYTKYAQSKQQKQSFLNGIKTLLKMLIS